ncbi:MAG TPA: Rieske 2Fe-2S domain-containing protein, partial [Ktedonobacterales bacterium]|nr:Rieske 2Fe-2S domain-containing protein [Ktedonobacterales bacterium]
TGTAGALALDPWLGAIIQPRLERWLGEERAQHLLAALDMAAPQTARPAVATKRPARGSSRYSKQQSRRDFLQGAAAGVAAMLTGLGLWNLMRPAASTTGGVATPPPGATGATGAGGNTALTTLNQMSDNSAVTFTIPSNQDPGVLIRLASGNVVAYDATCTHAGCTVQYDPSSQQLVCPCHGAAFDPAHNASVLAGPTDQPLAPVAINVNQQTGAITLQ